MGQFNVYDPYFVDTPPIPAHPSDPYMGKCDCCGKECERRPGVRFCSWACKDKGVLIVLPEKECPWCGIYYTPKIKKQLMCSRKCSREKLSENNRRRKMVEGAKECKQCSQKLDNPRLGQLYCGSKCQQQASYDRRGGTKREKRKCLMCNELFMPKNKNGVLCSDKCKRKNKTIKENARYHEKNKGAKRYKKKT